MDIRKIGVLIIVLVVIASVSFFKFRTEEDKILTIKYNGNEERVTLEELMEMEKTSIKTHDPHLGREILYEGVSLETIKNNLTIICKNVKIIAEDGYNKIIDSKDFGTGIIIAYKADGDFISKGDGGLIKLSFSEEAQKIYDEKNWVWWITRLEFQQ